MFWWSILAGAEEFYPGMEDETRAVKQIAAPELLGWNLLFQS
jgi:hypothetical protein